MHTERISRIEIFQKWRPSFEFSKNARGFRTGSWIKAEDAGVRKDQSLSPERYSLTNREKQTKLLDLIKINNLNKLGIAMTVKARPPISSPHFYNSQPSKSEETTSKPALFDSRARFTRSLIGPPIPQQTTPLTGRTTPLSQPSEKKGGADGLYSLAKVAELLSNPENGEDRDSNSPVRKRQKSDTSSTGRTSLSPLECVTITKTSGKKVPSR